MSENPETKTLPEAIPEAKEVGEPDEKDPKDSSIDPSATEGKTEAETKPEAEKGKTEESAPQQQPPPKEVPNNNNFKQPRQQLRNRLNLPKVPNKEALLGVIEAGNAKFSILKDTLNFDNFRTYFQVNSSYVINKLKRVLFPHFFCDENTLWSQKCIRGKDGTGEYAPPAMDVNALDLYIPFMAYATYLLLCVFLYGLAGFYSTSLFEKIATKAACVIAIEALLFKGGLYLLTDHDTSIAEIVGYCGYAFPGICLSVIANVFLGFKLSFVVMCFFAFEMSCFLKRTFSVLITRTSHVKERNVKSGTAYEIGSRRFFIAFICLLQFVVAYYLTYYF